MPTKRSRPTIEELPAPAAMSQQPALSMLPRGVYIMTASYDGRRVGVVVELLQLAATDPPSVSLALPKGQPISPLVRDSHAFGICVVPEGDAFLRRHFAKRDGGVEDFGDPFDGISTYTLATGSPLIERASACLDCSVTMHIDFEGDHELYIASVVVSRVHGGAGTR